MRNFSQLGWISEGNKWRRKIMWWKGKHTLNLQSNQAIHLFTSPKLITLLLNCICLSLKENHLAGFPPPPYFYPRAASYAVKEKEKTWRTEEFNKIPSNTSFIKSRFISQKKANGWAKWCCQKGNSDFNLRAVSFPPLNCHYFLWGAANSGLFFLSFLMPLSRSHRFKRKSKSSSRTNIKNNKN